MSRPSPIYSGLPLHRVRSLCAFVLILLCDISGINVTMASSIAPTSLKRTASHEGVGSSGHFEDALGAHRGAFPQAPRALGSNYS